SQTWRQRERSDFAQGETKGLSLLADGVLRLSPRLDSIYESKQPYLWALAQDASGNLYASGGNDGTIYRVGESGAGVFFKAQEPSRVLFDSAETHIRSLMMSPKGDLIAGSDGHGLVFRVSPQGEAFVLYDSPLNEVVALAPGKGGTLYAAVAGESGRPSRPS